MNHQTLLRLVRGVVPRTAAFRRCYPTAGKVLEFALPTSPQLDPEWAILDTFDWYSPRYQRKHTYRQVERWFRQLGFIDVKQLGVPVAVRGHRAGQKADT